MIPENPDDRPSCHEPFSSLTKEGQNDPLAQFAHDCYEIAAGINVCLELAFMSNLDRSACSAAIVPTLNAQDTEYLFRLSITCTRLLKKQAESAIDGINTRASKNLNTKKGGAR